MQPAARVQGQTISAAALAKGKKEYVSKCFNSISSHIGAKSLLWALLSVADPQIRSAPGIATPGPRSSTSPFSMSSKPSWLYLVRTSRYGLKLKRKNQSCRLIRSVMWKSLKMTNLSCVLVTERPKPGASCPDCFQKSPHSDFARFDLC
jgi:hypothetical protein